MSASRFVHLHIRRISHSAQAARHWSHFCLTPYYKWLSEDPNRTKGEMVLIVEGKPKSEDSDEFAPQAIKALTLIAKELPLKKAAAIVAELYGYKKNALYQFGLDNLN